MTAPNTHFHEMLLKKHQERLEKFEARRQARLTEKLDSKETSEAFLETFNKEKRDIVAALLRVDGLLDRMQIASMFDEISQKILNLYKYVSDSLSFLHGYEMRRAQEILKKIRNEVIEKRNVLLPKKKFKFKSRQRITSNKTGKPDTNDVKNTIEELQNVYLPASAVGFSDRFNETLRMEETECMEKDLNLSNIVDCTVYIKGYPSAMRINKVINSKIFCGPVCRSIFITDCFDSTFQLACQQLRIHTTGNTKFYIHVTSKAIIEDCEDLGFSTYTYNYEKINEHFLNSKLARDVNNWNDVDDFNWLKLGVPSPNWKVIEDE